MESTGWLRFTLGTLAIGILAVVATLGGPEDAWLKVRAVTPWGHPPPRIVSFERDMKAANGTYIATLRNPSLETVTVTGYFAQPHKTVFLNATTNNGAVTVMDADEPEADECVLARRLRLPQPLLIEPKSVRAIRIRPWLKACMFEIAFDSDHGPTGSQLSIDMKVLRRAAVPSPSPDQ